MLLKGWGTDDRLLLLHLVRAIDAQERADRRDRVYLHPELLRARLEMTAYIKRGGTSATHASEHSGTKSVPQSSASGMMSVKVTSSVLGVSESLVRRDCRSGKLAATQLRPRSPWLIDSESVEMRRRQKDGQT